MNRWLAVAVVGALASSPACKPKEVIKPDPATTAELQACRQKVADQKKLLEQQDKQIADLKLNADDDGVVVTVQGDLLTITAGADKGPHRGEPKGNAKDEALYAEFVKAVKNARGKIKKCYQNALKKDSKLQARTVSLNIQVNFSTSGRMTSASFSPRISDAFDKCLENVANDWKLPAAPRKVAFQYRMSLTPE